MDWKSLSFLISDVQFLKKSVSCYDLLIYVAV